MSLRRRFADREDLLGIAMLAPALGYVLLLVGVPFVLAIVLSFSTATAGSLSFGWAGFANYAAILTDPIFRRALANTVIVTIGSQLLVVVRRGSSCSCRGPCPSRSPRSPGRGSSIPRSA